ncbi:MAG: UDP-N-acetylmuramoyl-L-alanine--D-glutamate ligase [Ruminococcaceae bacterium]|nr:UDP-N-acetylmuramoyl-L-alanine--D-glutamate ligase [Oscillospiraceae bacterium]
MEKGGAKRFFEEIRGKRVTVCGIGINNTPVIRQFLAAGAKVTACDRRTREQLGSIANELEAEGAVLQLGEGYLDRLDADLILRTPGMKPYLPQFEEARARGVTVTSEMELFFALCPAPIYAVTGSDGKTTTTTILARLLEASGRRVWLGGNIGRALLPFIHEVQANDAAVVELSSFQLTGMTQSPHVAVVTNVAPNHLDWHTDMQEYIDAKRNLVLWQTAGDRTVLNADNAITCGYAEGLRSSCSFFSRLQKPQNGAYLRKDGMLCAVSEEEETPVVAAAEIRIPGVHNVENYLAAIAALRGEVAPAVIADFARTFGGVEHRSEWVRTVNGVRWYNDSIGSSPSRTVAGLHAFDRKVILIAGGYDKHIPYDPLGEAAKDTVKAAVLLGATADAIEEAIRAHCDLPIERVATMEEAVAAAHKLAVDGDIVFLSPASASFDMYKNFEERGCHFKRLVLELEEEETCK